MRHTKIVIAGIGGVGGYFGGWLAKHYENSNETEVCFVARGEHLKRIKSEGLKVIHGDTGFTARPRMTSDQPAEIGIADYIIVSCKSYDLEGLIHQLKPCVGEHTVILPLLNGVDSSDKIRNLLPGTLVADGCVYIVSRIQEPGVVINTGAFQKLFFGLDQQKEERLEHLSGLMKASGMEATLSETISAIVWEKFVFISPYATTTSAYDLCLGDIRSDESKFGVLQNLVKEIISVARAKSIDLPADIYEKTLVKLKALPHETTTSMHNDFKRNPQKTEYQSLTGYVIKEAEKFNLQVPVYTEMYQRLEQKSKG